MTEKSMFQDGFSPKSEAQLGMKCLPANCPSIQVDCAPSGTSQSRKEMTSSVASKLLQWEGVTRGSPIPVIINALRHGNDRFGPIVFLSTEYLFATLGFSSTNNQKVLKWVAAVCRWASRVFWLSEWKTAKGARVEKTGRIYIVNILLSGLSFSWPVWCYSFDTLTWLKWKATGLNYPATGK